MMEFTDKTSEFLDGLPDLDTFILQACSDLMCSREESIQLYESYQMEGFRVYENDDYAVTCYPIPAMGMIRLTITNQDQSAKHDWRDFQEIKNVLVGPENEAAELYPAESRKRDFGNAFHLFALVGSMGRFPFGAYTRRVSNTPPSGYSQRPLPDYDLKYQE